MRIDLFTGTDVSERAVHARLPLRVPDVKCAQSDNLVSLALNTRGNRVHKHGRRETSRYRGSERGQVCFWLLTSVGRKKYAGVDGSTVAHRISGRVLPRDEPWFVAQKYFS